MVSAAEAMKLRDVEKKSPPSSYKIDFSYVDSQIAKRVNPGYTEDQLKKVYEAFGDLKIGDKTLPFGVGVGQMPPEIYSGNLGTGSNYIDSRIQIIDELLGLLSSAQGPDGQVNQEALHKVNSLLQLSKKVSADNPARAFHHLEFMEAAKTAIANDTEAQSLFNQYNSSVLYDGESLQKTLAELTSRREHLYQIKNQGYDHYEKYGLPGKVAQNALPLAVSAVSSVFFYKDFTTFFKSLWNGKMLLNSERNLFSMKNFMSLPATGVGGGIHNLIKFSGKGLWIALRSHPFIASFSLFVGAATLGSNLYISYKEPNSNLNKALAGIKNLFYGKAKTGFDAFLSWIVPGYGTLYMTDNFHSDKQQNLASLKEQGAKKS
jgi:hypothetical protein